MPQVVIKCPNTGKTVPVGMSVDKETFATWDVGSSQIGPCPACGETHTWSKADAWVEE